MGGPTAVRPRIGTSATLYNGDGKTMRPKTSLGRIAEPEEIASAGAVLVLGSASYITITVDVDGGRL